MGTDNNKQLLSDIGISGPEIKSASPNDLIVALFSYDQALIDTILANLDQWLESESDGNSEVKPRTLEDGLAAQPSANLVVISVPGEFAFREANKALKNGLNVFLFSDNVPVSEELQLKQFASNKGLLVMGPDCGTSIINGIGIGFANKVRRGRIGLVGASGTGIQEFTSQIHNAGLGISQAIGTGGHDLSDKIGGLTTLAGLQLLEEDVNTEVIAIISKPPGRETIKSIFEAIPLMTKPVVGCFLGMDPILIEQNKSFQLARTIDAAVSMTMSSSKQQVEPNLSSLSEEEVEKAYQEREKLRSQPKIPARDFRGGDLLFSSPTNLKRFRYPNFF